MVGALCEDKVLHEVWFTVRKDQVKTAKPTVKKNFRIRLLPADHHIMYKTTSMDTTPMSQSQTRFNAACIVILVALAAIFCVVRHYCR